jgi:threonine/homoserine/homoserine lactone efflux protein
MTTQLILGLVAFAFVSSITPGPNNLMLMASGTNFGFVRTVPHMLGVALGFVAMVLLVGAGLAQIFVRFPIMHEILKWVSVSYLLFLAWKIAHARPPQATPDAAAQPFTFMQAALFQWVNPKAWTMALTAVTAYVPTQNPWISLVTVGIVFGLVNLPSVSAWALLGAQLRRFLDRPEILKAFNYSAALLLIASLYPIIFDKH